MLAALGALAGACGKSPAPAPSVQMPAPAADSAELDALRERTAQLESELAAARAAAAAHSCEELEAEVASLRRELTAEQERRLEREREWLRYTNVVSALDVKSIPDDVHFEAQVPASERPKPPEPPPPVDEARIARQKEIQRSLRTLLAVEGVRGLDLLEAGELGQGWIGPVVFRLLDERGRLAGNLSAQRLRLEGSRTARTLSIVLENGYEMRGGVRTPFTARERSDAPPLEGGVRRIEIDDVDPLSWVQALPELFGDVALEPPKDDGLWNVTYVRGALNRLLRADAEHGYFRVRECAGVTAGELRDVHLEGFDGAGKLERHLFADRLKVELTDKGVLLLLQDGAQVRGDEKVPFLDGRFRIFLPRARREDWLAAGLPGLSQPDGAPKDGAAEAGAPKDGH